MQFHPRCHGKNITLSEGATVATRTGSFNYGIVFGDKPVASLQKITVELKTSAKGWSGGLRYGFTNHNPDNVNPSTLPQYAIPDLTKQPGNWAKAMSEAKAKEGNKLSFYFTKQSTVLAFINDEHYETSELKNSVDISKPVWPLCDVYGCTRCIKLETGRAVIPANQGHGNKFETFKKQIGRAIQHLKTCTDFAGKGATEALLFIANAREYGANPCNDQRALGLYLVEEGYGQLFVRMWKGLNSSLEKEKWDQAGLFNLQLMMDAYTHFTDRCPVELGADLGKNGCILLLLQGLEKLKIYFEQPANFSIVQSVVFDIFAILHNSIHQYSTNREIYRTAGAVDILKEQMKSENSSIRLFSLLILAYIINESESEILATSGEGVASLVQLLKKAVNEENHKAAFESMAFSALELLNCLNRLAINDSNKLEIEREGGIPAITRMLEDDFSEEEQKVAAEMLWNLAFVESVRQSRLLQNADQPLEKLLRSSNKGLHDTCAYAIWQISGTNRDSLPTIRNLPEEPPSYQEAIKESFQTRSLAQIMISYQWDFKQKATKIRDGLINSGYKVWMDDTHMRGDILAAIADAIEKSVVVLICMSEKYKDSQSCRSEAEYAYKLKKNVIPILVEDGYEPDGWLGLLQGTKLYYRFYSDELIKTEMTSLLTAIRECVPLGRDSVEGPIQVTRQIDVFGAAPSPRPGQAALSPVRNWTETDVQDWLKKSKLREICDALESYDGKHLAKMYSHYREDPKDFKDDMKSDYQMNSKIYLKFTVALEELFQK